MILVIFSGVPRKLSSPGLVPKTKRIPRRRSTDRTDQRIHSTKVSSHITNVTYLSDRFELFLLKLLSLLHLRNFSSSLSLVIWRFEHFFTKRWELIMLMTSIIINRYKRKVGTKRTLRLKELPLFSIYKKHTRGILHDIWPKKETCVTCGII